MPKPPKKNAVAVEKGLIGWIKRNREWISPIASVVSTVSLVTGLCWHFAALEIDKQVTAKLQSPINDIQQLKSDLGKLQTRVETFIQLEQKRLEQIGEIKPTELSKQLPKATAALQGATELRIPPPQNFDHFESVLRDADRATPGFWPAAAALIDYKSSIKSNPQSELLESCFTEKHIAHSFKGNLVPPSPITDYPRYYEFGDCSMDLDDLVVFDRANLPFINDPRRAHQQIIFKLFRVRLGYHGGLILPIEEIECHDCTFDFHSGPSPAEPSKRLIESLLYADLDTVKLAFPGG